MTEKTARQIENLKNQTIGVEVEMNSITRKAAAQLAAEYFGTGRWEDTAYRNGYYSASPVPRFCCESFSAFRPFVW